MYIFLLKVSPVPSSIDASYSTYLLDGSCWLAGWVLEQDKIIHRLLTLLGDHNPHKPQVQVALEIVLYVNKWLVNTGD